MCRPHAWAAAPKFRSAHQEALLGLLGDEESAVQPPPPPYFGLLDDVVGVAGEAATYLATASDYGQLQNFLNELNRGEGVHYNVSHQEAHGGQLTRVYTCAFGGKPNWQERTTCQSQTEFKRPQACGHSIKVGCGSKITAFFSLPYAQTLGLARAPSACAGPSATAATPAAAAVVSPAVPPSAASEVSAVRQTAGPSTPELCPQPASAIRLHLQLGHTGHNPNSPTDLMSLPTDPRCERGHG